MIGGISFVIDVSVTPRLAEGAGWQAQHWLYTAEHMEGQEPGCGRKQAKAGVRGLQHLVRKLPGSHCGPLATEDRSHA